MNNNKEIVVESLDKIIDFILNSEPIAFMLGTEFPQKGKNLNIAVIDFWNKEYGGKIYKKNIGEILLDNRSVKDSIAHGIYRNKIVGFISAPEVILKGKLLEYNPNRNNKNYKSFTFIAPIKIGNIDYVQEVIVKSNKDRTGLYVNRVEIKKKLEDVLRTAQHGTSPTSKLSIIHKICFVKKKR